MNNFIMLAQNSNYDYVRQAYACALSILINVPNSRVALVTNDIVPKEYEWVFDKIIEIPWGDLAEKHDWKIHNRWKILHVLPYDDAIVLDTDMLVLNDISHWFDFLRKYDIFFTTNVKTYRDEIITSDFYRQRYNKHKLPKLYSGLHFITKNPKAFEFYKVLDTIVQNWDMFAGKIQKNASIDTAAALSAKILDCENDVTSKVSIPNFIHMKPNCQNWEKLHETWRNRLGVYFTPNAELWIGNYKQTGVFHYTEKEFLTDQIITTLEGVANG